MFLKGFQIYGETQDWENGPGGLPGAGKYPGDSEVPVTLSWNVTRLHDYLFGIKDYEPSAGVQERSAHIEEVSGFSKGSAVSKENYTLNGEEAGKDVDDNIPGIQETESETETQTQEAAVSDNGDGSVYDDNSYDQEQYNDYSPDGYNYDEEYWVEQISAMEMGNVFDLVKL